jgi:hypothetical protein
MDVLTARARQSVLIIGVNLEGALGCAATLTALVRSGGTVRLLAMDPDGAALVPSALTSGVDPALRRGKIVQNLELLRKEFAQLSPRPAPGFSCWLPISRCQRAWSAWTRAPGTGR